MWTQKHLQQLLTKGTIRGYSLPIKTKTHKIGGRRVVKHWKRKNVVLNHISLTLLCLCNENNLELYEEYYFTIERKWRFDFVVRKSNDQDFKLAFEFEGGIFQKVSGHKSTTGIQRDIEKYNLAQQLGYTVIRLSAINYREVANEFNVYIKRNYDTV